MAHVALVTGGNRGIGYEVARQLADLGLAVLITARKEKEGIEAAAKLADDSKGARIVARQLDVTDEQSVERLASTVLSEFGRLDVLVNNAGIYPDKDVPCHVNGHTSGAFHLVGDIRPQENRRRIETPSLRGVNIQRLFGSQRALKTVEDFTEFEQRAAYFDGDPVIATKKGLNILDRGSQVHDMSEFQDILDFPPAPKLNILGRLDRTKASEAEARGEDLFFGKANCVACHTPPFYTDNTMHDLKVERFYKPRMEGGMLITAQGPIKTFPLRGIKESPPYLHDGRLLTLEDAVEFFNLVQQLSLTQQEKSDLVAFLRIL